MRKTILTAILIAALMLTGCQTSDSSDSRLAQSCISEATGASMPITEAMQIAKDTCKDGTLKDTRVCNEGTATWWIDFQPTSAKQGCNPACVVNVDTKQAEINWRCTGLIPPQ